MQRACAILSSVAPLASPGVSILSHILHDFRRKGSEYKTCVLIFITNLLEPFLILRRIHRDIVIYVKAFLCKVPVIFVGFY